MIPPADDPEEPSGTTLDITDRKQFEDRLAYDTHLLENVRDAVVATDERLVVTAWNRGAERIYGFTADEAVGRDIRELVRSQLDPDQRRELLRTLAETGHGHVETIHHREDGTSIDIEGHVIALRDVERRVTGYVTVQRDITTRKQAEEAVRLAREDLEQRVAERTTELIAVNEVLRTEIRERRRAEEQLRRSEAYLAEAERLSHTGSWAWNVATGELFWSLEHFRICGVDPKEFTLTLESAHGLIHPEDLAAAQQAFYGAIENKTPFEYRLRMRRPDGTIRHVYSLAHPVFSESGQLTQYVGTVIDVTEHKQADEERVGLLHRLISAHEEERRRISREIHDEFGQQLSLLGLKIGSLKHDCAGQAEVTAQIESIEAVLRQLDSDVDFLVWNLRPTALDDLGLVVALSNVIAQWARHFGTRAELHTVGMDNHRLTSEVEVALYRILQEALTNVAKHAAAENVHVFLERQPGQVSLIVEDDGKGCDAEHAVESGEGRGLIGIRERAALVGGTLEIESPLARGTTVVVQIPLKDVSGVDVQHA